MSASDREAAAEFEPSLERLRARRATKWRHVDDDVLPAWVAETDFELCPAIVDAVAGVLERGDLGYPDWWSEPLAEPFSERMGERYGWRPDPAHVRHVCDLIQAVEVVVGLSTETAGAVAMHVPNYPPFLRALDAMGRRTVGVPMELAPPSARSTGEARNRWGFDPDRLDGAVGESGAKVLIVVNPHNPTGRVFRLDELEALADVACRHDMVVISDELHAELTHDGHRHVPFASLGEEVARRTVTITSATKSFNLGGLRSAVVHLGDDRMRAKWDRFPPEYFGSLNVVGVEATLAAWRHGGDWLDRQNRHLTAMRDCLTARMADLPGLSMQPPEATYLAWIDCRAASLGDDPADYFREHARVELSRGPTFGPGGDGFARLNFATGRLILDEMLDRLRASLPRRASEAPAPEPVRQK